jgi:hypothetical protein
MTAPDTARFERAGQLEAGGRLCVMAWAIMAVVASVVGAGVVAIRRGYLPNPLLGTRHIHWWCRRQLAWGYESIFRRLGRPVEHRSPPASGGTPTASVSSV